MKPLTKAAKTLTILFVLPILLLTSCADAAWPTWLTGEPDASVLNAPRIVGRPSGNDDMSYPNLASVPQKPDVFTDKDTRRRYVDEMLADREEADAVKERIESGPASLLPRLLAPSPSPFSKDDGSQP